MIVKLLTEHHLEFLSLKGGCTGCLSLYLSNYHFVGNHMSRFNYNWLWQTTNGNGLFFILKRHSVL